MENEDKQIHVRLTSDIFKKLKVKCASRSESIQNYVSDLIASNLLQQPPHKKSKSDKKDKKLDILNLLGECQILEDVDLYELKKLADVAIQQHFIKNQTLIQEEELDSCYIIASGLVKIYKSSPSGREFIIDVLDRGKVFGLGTLISGVAYPGGVQAMEDTDMVLIPKRDFLVFVSRNPKVMVKITNLERARVNRLYAQLIDMVTYKADQRVIKVLSELAGTHGNILPFTQRDIAELSGTTNETVSRIMAKLKNQGVLKSSRGNIHIIDNNRLTF